MARSLRNTRYQLSKVREELPTETWATDDVMNFKLVDSLIEINQKFEDTMNWFIEIIKSNVS
jgi:hypothetical protein